MSAGGGDEQGVLNRWRRTCKSDVNDCVLARPRVMMPAPLAEEIT